MAGKQGTVMKKGWKIFVCLGMTVCMLGGCGGQESGETDNTTMGDTVQSGTDGTETLPDGTGEVSAPGTEAVVPPLTDYVSAEEMERADMWGSCDDTALAAVMRKAAAGEKVTIACIGGSITQGTISNGSDDSEVCFKKCYADIFFEWWENTFPPAVPKPAGPFRTAAIPHGQSAAPAEAGGQGR